MVKVFIVYDTKYGNTKLVAEYIVEGMKGHEGIEATIRDVEDIDLDNIPDFDVILIGSPNHVGSPARSINRFIDKIGELNLAGKQVAVFDTYLGGDFNKVVSKIEERIKEKAPGLSLITSGLSIKVDGMRGPITQGELLKCRDFGKIIALQISG